MLSAILGIVLCKRFLSKGENKKILIPSRVYHTNISLIALKRKENKDVEVSFISLVFSMRRISFFRTRSDIYTIYNFFNNNSKQ